ncbi:MAG: hypothetical protein ABL999_15260 [Pyrinomonadaceae bacterium]
MKTCPNCRKTYGDDLFFCLDDGSPLSTGSGEIDPDAPTEAAFNVGSSLRTEVLQSPVAVSKTTQIHVPSPSPSPVKPSSKLPYVIIALLAFVCLTLGGVLVGMNIDRIFPKKEIANANVAVPANTVKPSPSPAVSVTQNTPATPEVRSTRTAVVNRAIGKWSGKWSTDSGTLFDFELKLLGTAENGLDGSIRWTMRRTARDDKTDKIGLSATEFVRGSFSPGDGTVKLSGYRKDDPSGVLVMLDEYKLAVSPDGNSLTGSARNGGKWNGHVSLLRAADKAAN